MQFDFCSFLTVIKVHVLSFLPFLCSICILIFYFYCFCFSPNQDIQLYAIGLINSLFMRATNKKVSLQDLQSTLSKTDTFGTGTKCPSQRGVCPGAPLTYFNDGGVRRIFWGLTFWPKGIFLGL